MEKLLLRLKQNMVRLIAVECRAAKMGCIEIPLAVIPFVSRNGDFLVQTLNGLFSFALTEMVLPMTSMRDIGQAVNFLPDV